MDVIRAELTQTQAVTANRRWWDDDAEAYDAEHRDFLGDATFIWCPEGLDEAAAGLLGDVHGAKVLEVGCGSASCGRWLTAAGAHAVSFDVSAGMLAVARRRAASTGVRVPLVQADACEMPFAAASIDVACSAFGAVPFVAEPAALMSEVARVLAPGGSWTFSVTHPMRWCFPDDPGPAGLTAGQSYFDRTPYVEIDDEGRPAYVETHRTMGDRIRDIVAAGLVLVDVVEPEWQPGVSGDWGQWSALRGGIFPGTAIFRTCKPGS